MSCIQDTTYQNFHNQREAQRQLKSKKKHFYSLFRSIVKMKEVCELHFFINNRY